MDGIVARIAQDAPQAAKRWADNLRTAIGGLAQMPHRFSVARESISHTKEIHEMLFGRGRNYRVLYSIEENTVVVLAIRHAARDDFDPNEF